MKFSEVLFIYFFLCLFVCLLGEVMVGVVVVVGWLTLVV